MTPTKQVLDQQAQKTIVRGINTVYEAVRRTLGPGGGNGLIYGNYGRSPRITNDGVTISDIIEPKDEFEALAANVFKDAAKKTNMKAGDGTTTTEVIAGKLVNQILSEFSESCSIIGGKNTEVIKIRNTIIEQANKVILEIQNRAKKIECLEDLEKIAMVSVEDQTLGKIVAKIAWQVGVDGYIDVVEGHKGEIETEVIEGARFPAKVAAKVFVNHPQRYEMVVEETPVVITNYKFENIKQLEFLNLLKEMRIVILAPEFSEQVLIELVKARKNNFIIMPVKTPSLRTEQYEDISIYAGATFINKDVGKKLENITKEDLGWLEKITVKDSEAKEDAVMIGGKGTQEGKMKVAKQEYAVTSPVTERIKILKAQIEETKVDSHKKLLERRIASMASAIGVIRVGGASDAEIYYKKKKLEDAVYSCRAALQEGYVKGGGLCLKEIAEQLPQSILTEALKAPYQQIQQNSGGNLEISEDIIDPAKAVRLEVEHAISVSANLVTVKVIIAEIAERSPYDQYSDIAQAINRYITFWAKQQGLIKENAEEISKDMWEYQNDITRID